VPFELQLYHKHLTLEYRILGCFGDMKNSLRRNWDIFHRCTHSENDSRLLFQKWSKSVQDAWPKGRVALITKKQNTFWHLAGAEPLRRFPPFFLCKCAVCTVPPHLYSKFHPDRFRFGEVITEKPVTRPQSKCNIGSLSLYQIFNFENMRLLLKIGWNV